MYISIESSLAVNNKIMKYMYPGKFEKFFFLLVSNCFVVGILAISVKLVNIMAPCVLNY